MVILMANTATRKGTTLVQNGQVDGVLSVTTENTTLSINVSTVSGYESVTSILYASATYNLGAASTTIAYPYVQWTTTDATIKLTVPTAQSTVTVGVRFVGK